MHAHARPPAPARAVLALGLVALVAGLLVVLSEREQRVAETNDAGTATALAQDIDGLRTCRSRALGGDWRAQAPPSVLRRSLAIARDRRGDLCLVIGRPGGVVLLGDVGGPPSRGAPQTSGRNGLRVEYLRTGRETWWSLAPAVPGRMRRGHALGVVWVAPLVATLGFGAVVVAVTLLRPGRR